MKTILLLFSLWCATGALLAAIPSRPDVILVMSDDQGWGETGYNGHPYIKTPVLDEMARTALRFDRFYAASPLCSPTRASVMTGRHANRSGAFAPNWSTRPEEITIAHILKRAGYRTGHFGKWHLGAVKKESPVNPGRMGFDEYLSHDNFFEMDPALSRNGAAPQVLRGESSEILVNEALKFVRRVRAESVATPFFVVIWFGSPHAPYSATAADAALYADVPKPSIRLRFSEITAMDRAIGTLRTELRRLGVAENTLLWFNSDNGIGVEPDDKVAFNGGWRGQKADIYEGGLRVPAVIEWPAVIKQPRATAMPCVTSDILPTLLDLLQLKAPDPQRPIDGISLRPLIVDGTMRERPSPIGFWKYPAAAERKHPRWIDAELSRGTTPTTKTAAIDFMNHRHPVAKMENFGGEAAWTDSRYKLIVITPANAAARTELYDLIADPHEQHDLAPYQPAVVAAMTAQLEDWQRSVERSLTGADY